MTKRTKKENRLSPKAKELIKLSQSGSIPLAYLAGVLRSINPKDLNLYDRQRIGREIRAVEQIKNKYFIAENLEREYDVASPETLKIIQRGTSGRYDKKAEIRASIDRDFADALKYEKQESSSTPGFYCYAGERYAEIGLLDKAQVSYEHARNTLRFLPQEGSGKANYEELALRISSGLDALKHRNDRTGEKRTAVKSSGLEKVTATTSILSLLGSIFFLSNNVTGNAISSLTQTTSNWIGVGLFCVAIVCGIFALKRK